MSEKLKHNWTLLQSSNLMTTPFFGIRKDQFRNESTKRQFDVTVMEAVDAVNVIPVTEDQCIVFVKQFRFGIQEVTLELPGGMMEAGESVEEAGKRELIEETGYSSEEVEYLGKTASHPVIMNSYLHHIVMKNVILDKSTDFDDAEMIELALIPIHEIADKMKEGIFNHPHTISALVRYL